VSYVKKHSIHRSEFTLIKYFLLYGIRNEPENITWCDNGAQTTKITAWKWCKHQLLHVKHGATFKTISQLQKRLHSKQGRAVEIIFVPTVSRFISICDILTFHELCLKAVVLGKLPSCCIICFTLHKVTLRRVSGSNKILVRLYDTTCWYHVNPIYKNLLSKTWRNYLHSSIKHHY
jgi:hypothetical protein